MRSKKRPLRSWRLYSILDNQVIPDEKAFAEKFYELLKCPVDAIQFRFEDRKRTPARRALERMLERARSSNVPVIVNDSVEMALSCSFAGVHLGRADLPARLVRKMLGPGRIVGRTVRGVKDLEDAEPYCDYLSIGPVFRTPVKKGLKTIPLDTVREICRLSKRPVVAIGGITADNAERVLRAGVRTVAFMRYGVTDARTAHEMERLRDVVEHR